MFNSTNDKALLVEESFDLHVGLGENYADMFMAKMAKTGIEVHQADDGWESWGSPVGSDTNDQNTFHVVLRFSRIQNAISSAIEIAHRYIDILTPLQRQTPDETLNGITVSVTLAGNWAERFIDVYRTESRTLYVKFRPNQVALPYK